MSRGFPGGAWLVDLAPVQESSAVLGTVAKAMDLRMNVGNVEDAIRAKLAAHRTLLILDNCEHVLDAAASLACSLLHKCPELSILATSREALGVTGELTMPLGPLDLPSPTSHQTADSARRFAGIQLFVERASAANPAFQLRDTNAAEVSRVCRQLDGVPLGIELAAVRLRSFALNYLSDRLDEQLTLENRSARTGSSRHGSLGAALDVTYDLLDDDERRLWSRLSVFAGSFSLEAATEVCSDPTLPRDAFVDTFARLVEKSGMLVVGDGRYRLLEPIRQYCRHRLQDAGEEARFLRGHFDWCQRIVSSGQPWWDGRDQLRWLQAMFTEEKNIQVAMSTSLQGHVSAEQGLGLLYTSWWAWVTRWGAYDWTRHCAINLLHSSGLSSTATVRGLLMAGTSAVGLSDWATATDELNECCRQALSSEDDLIIEHAYASSMLAIVQMTAGGDVEGALASLQQAVERFETKDANVLAVGFAAQLIHWEIDKLHITDAGRLQELASFATRVLAGSRDVWGRALLQSELGRLMWLLGEPDLAEQELTNACELQLAIGHTHGVARSLESLACIAGEAGRFERALALFSTVDRLWDESGAPTVWKETAHRAACEAGIRREVAPAKRAKIAKEAAELSLDLLVHAREETLSAVTTRPRSTQDVTHREYEVVQLIAIGASNKQIATRLGITPNTVKTHVAHVMRKLELDSRAELASWYSAQTTEDLRTRKEEGALSGPFL
jgi:predicted ATPase/DNA-binding CsgD family transcriptional regulator